MRDTCNSHSRRLCGRQARHLHAGPVSTTSSGDIGAVTLGLLGNSRDRLRLQGSSGLSQRHVAVGERKHRQLLAAWSLNNKIGGPRAVFDAHARRRCSTARRLLGLAEADGVKSATGRRVPLWWIHEPDMNRSVNRSEVPRPVGSRRTSRGATVQADGLEFPFGGRVGRPRNRSGPGVRHRLRADDQTPGVQVRPMAAGIA